MAQRRLGRAPAVTVDTAVGTPQDVANLADLGSLWGADGLEPLYAALLGEPLRRGSAGAFEPYLLFRQHHADSPDGAVLSALLLCTDDRWDKATGRLVRDIAESGWVPEGGLDELAEVFTWTDELWVECPVAWLDPHAETSGGVGTVPVWRRLRPPLRRWAAERRVRRGADAPATLLERAGELPDQHGSAVVLGLLDAADDLPDAERQAVLAAGLASSRAEVRRRALEVLVASGQAEEAHRRAVDDPAALVRRWGAKLAATLAGSAQTDHPPQTPPGARDARPSGPADAGAVQGSLFV